MKAKIGSLNSKQFQKLQQFLGEVEVPARMSILFSILEKEIEDGVKDDENQDDRNDE